VTPDPDDAPPSAGASDPGSSGPLTPVPPSRARDEDFYQALRSRVARWLEGKGKGFKHAQLVLLAPDLFHLLTRLMLDRRIPAVEKARLGAVLAYFVAPVDLLPEAVLGPAGYVDDVALAAYALSRLINAGHGGVARELWAGDGELIDVLQQILEVADEMLGRGLWTRIKGYWQGLG
jgi:uncharacterized membrane protein YkvA (DUF1232 family)